MSEFINANVFVQHILYFLKLSILANKGTEDDNSLERSITLYNRIKKIDMKEESDEEDDNVIRRYQKLVNLVLKVDDNGVPIDIRNKENQLRMVQLRSCEPIHTQNLAEMKLFLKQNDLKLFPGVSLDFLLKKSKHQELTWNYLLSTYHITQIVLSHDSEDPSREQLEIESTNILEKILINISKLEKKLGINKVLSKDKFLNTRLLKPNIKDDVEASKIEVRRLLSSRGINEDSVLFRLVDRIGDKLSGMDHDEGTIFSKIRSIVGEIGLEMRSDMNGNATDIKQQIGTVIDMFREVAKDNKEMDKMPENMRNMFENITTAIPTDPNEPISDERAKEIEALFKNNDMGAGDINKDMRGMAKAAGVDAAELAELEKLIQRSTPEQISTALKFKL